MASRIRKVPMRRHWRVLRSLERHATGFARRGLDLVGLNHLHMRTGWSVRHVAVLVSGGHCARGVLGGVDAVSVEQRGATLMP